MSLLKHTQTNSHPKHAGSKGGSAPLAPRSHPTRLTPVRNALRAIKTITDNTAGRRPADGGKMMQTKDSKPDSRTVAARVAMDQLMALGADCFDIGVKRVDGTMILREGWGAKQVLKSLLWLRRENFNRGHIYVRPAGTHGLSLVD